MKITLKALLITLGLLVAPLAWAQDNVYYPQVYTNGGQILSSVSSTGACPPTSCIGITIPTTVTTITVGVLGTFSATLQPEESQNGGYTWTSAGTAITTTGTTVYTVTAFTNFRVRASAYASGVANVNIQAGPTGGSGSAGAGVTSLNGLVGGVTLAGGTGITITPSGNTLTIASSTGGGMCPGGSARDIQFSNGTNCVNANTLFTGAFANIDSGGNISFGYGNEAVTTGPGSVTIQATDSTATMDVESNGNMTVASDAGTASFTGHSGVSLNSSAGGLTVNVATTFSETVNSVLGLTDSGAGLTVGSPTGGAKGAGTLNATGLYVNGTAVGTGNGTVTSVSFTGGLISVATPTTTPALTVAGTSGGIPYFSSASTWATSAALGANQVVLGGGAGSSPTSSAGLSYSAGTLTCGIAGTNGCVISMAGATSGAATITAPAVAGTSTNAIVLSNVLKVAAGGASSAGLQFPDGAGYGFFDSGGFIIAVANTHDAMAWSDVDKSTMPSQGLLGWTGTSGDPTATIDTNLCRSAAGTVEVASSATCGSSGTLLAATVRANTGFSANGTAGVSAGPFTAITSITSSEGLVTALSGTSDMRLKTNIHPYLRGLTEILQLHPALYHWNKEGQKITNFGPNVEQAGFLAQDVQKAFPEAIGTEPHDGVQYLNFNDRPIIAALVNAVKQQQAEINQLKKELANK